MEADVKVTTLANGFRVVTDANPRFETAALGVFIDAGARHESAERNGAAHFLEHMAFKGTARRSALEISESIEAVGGDINAWTGEERTAFHIHVLPEDAPLAADILGDILRNSVFAEEEMERERDVILQEIGRNADDPESLAYDWAMAAAYPKQPLGRPILGTEATVGAMTADDLRGFVTRHYRPGSMALAAAGAVDHAALVAQAEALFGDMPPGVGPAPAPARYVGGLHCEIEDLEQAHLYLSLRAPGHGDRDEALRMRCLSNILGGGASSRLFQEAREKRGLCYAVHSYANSFADDGLLTIYAGVGGERVAEMTAVIADELRRACDDVTEDEARKARNQVKAGALMARESPLRRAEQLASELLSYGHVEPRAAQLARIESVDAAVLRRAMRTLCADPRPAVALYGPVTAPPELDGFIQRVRFGS